MSTVLPTPLAPNADDSARAGPRPGTRIQAIDLIRGAVMILMAIDHLRVFAGVPAGGPSPGIFFTRWITHFCAPAFVFLAGSSAFLYGRTHSGLSRFLFLRGVWLVLLELTLIRVAWTFNFDFGNYLLAGVIWVIGWCMILMAALVRLSVGTVAGIGLAVIALHGALMPRFVSALPDGLAWLGKILYVGFFDAPVQLGSSGPQLVILYTIVPWIGVMAAGYAFGWVLTREPVQRNRLCLRIGLGATGLFFVLRWFDIYGDPSQWRSATSRFPALLAFLNTSKYPASLSFLLMTLGPTIALIPLLESARGALARWISVFGRVPFFFYMLHIPLIHALALVVSKIRSGAVSPWLFENHPMGMSEVPDGYRWNLATLYAVWAVAVLLLYFPSRWFADLKARRKEPWLSFL